jgi:shikimate kinase
MLVLVGLMGAGKSAVGRRLAQRLGVPFVDVDHEIELAADATIAEIWARDGEAAFRDAERRVFARLLAGPIGVLAAGGGAFMSEAIRTDIEEKGISIWLKADLETLVHRTARRSTRPLLNGGDPRTILQELMERRGPTYALADLTVETQPGPPEATVQAVIDGLSQLADAAGNIGAPIIDNETLPPSAP